MGSGPKSVWVLIATIMLAPAGGRGDEPRAPLEVKPVVQGCPLAIGRLPVRSWIARDHRTLRVRFVPVQSDFAHCLELDALSLVGPGGQHVHVQLRIVLERVQLHAVRR